MHSRRSPSLSQMRRFQMNAPKIIEEASTDVLTRIGAGSFAYIYVTGGDAIAFKTCQRKEGEDELHAEFNALRELYSKCSTDSFFAIPRPFGFYDHSTAMFVVNPPSPVLKFIRSGPGRQPPQQAFALSQTRTLIRFILWIESSRSPPSTRTIFAQPITRRSTRISLLPNFVAYISARHHPNGHLNS